MLGAPTLAAWAAVRAGAGLVRLLMPEPLLVSAMSVCPPATGVALAVDDAGLVAHRAAEAIDAALERCDALAVGPGLGTGEGERAAVLRCVQQDVCAVVVDAGALTCLAQTPELFRDLHAPAVLTPHPGEFRRLCAGLGLKGDLGLDRSRKDACAALAQRLGRVVVLKGASTVVSDGLRTWVCPVACPALAAGGTGDVLTGLIAGLIAQFVPSPTMMLARARVSSAPSDPQRPLGLLEAACVGVLAHARAGELWAARRGVEGGLSPTDLPDLLPEILGAMRA
jgi:NAD(P)H-hydrate epimerase